MITLRGTTPSNPRGAHKAPARGTTPSNPRRARNDTRVRANREHAR
jgi:hypothetical protein